MLNLQSHTVPPSSVTWINSRMRLRTGGPRVACFFLKNGELVTSSYLLLMQNLGFRTPAEKLDEALR